MGIKVCKGPVYIFSDEIIQQLNNLIKDTSAIQFQEACEEVSYLLFVLYIHVLCICI